ncbi:MAG: glutamate synthase-related protein [Ginsengibacter sp.]
MFQNKKTFSFSRVFLLLVIAVNVFVSVVAYVHHQDIYWMLLWSIPTLLFAFYYDGIVSKKTTRDKTLRNNDFKFPVKDNPVFPRKIKANKLTVLFGNSHCAKPYLSSIICNEAVSADQNIINYTHRAIGSFEVNRYQHQHRQNLYEPIETADELANDVIWKIKPGYADCRDQNFNFNPELFRLNASRSFVKMVEIELSTATEKNTIFRKNFYSVASVNQTQSGRRIKPINTHSAFGSAESMAIFLDSVRKLSGKKPVGIRLCITDKKEFHEMCFAFRKTEIIPDYIVVEGCVNKNNALDSSQKPGMLLYEALLFVSKTLEMYGLSKEIKIIAATEIYTALDVLKLHALGADAISIQNRLTRSDRYYETDDVQTTTFSQQCIERLRTDLINGAVNIMQSWGYKNIKEVTLSSFFRNMDALQPEDSFKIYDQDFHRDTETKPFRILKNIYQEENKNSAVALN